MMTRICVVAGLIIILSTTSYAKQTQRINPAIRDVNIASIQLTGERLIHAKHFRSVSIDVKQLLAQLKHAPAYHTARTSQLMINLPWPDGSMHQYKIMQNNTMHPELAAKFPAIQTWDGYGTKKNPGEFVKLDMTPQGFHAMILSAGNHSIFIDPLEKNNTRYYMVYNKKDFLTKKTMRCQVNSQNTTDNSFFHGNQFTPFFSCNTRTYRLAMAATAQYTAFHGGTVQNALAAEVTTMNRVNGIYERDMAITMQLIGNNNSIIYTNPATQPYTHNDPDALILENQTNLDAVIGSAFYDIGHVVDADGSGLAAVASVCDASSKAEGATGQAAPIGDPFDVDYVAHEMGHQFGAQHTQNNACNRNDPTAVEPGSGSTIMGYAGICPPNVKASTDAYFHGISLQQMGNFVSNPGHTCAVITPLPPAPTITIETHSTTLPVNTPFALTALPDASNIATYTWEQMDNQITPQPPVSTATGGPVFRSVMPVIDSTRYLPSLLALANNGPYTWEVLPAVSRPLHFRVTLRGNQIGGYCNSYADMSINTDANYGPFVVTLPTKQSIWLGKNPNQVTWDVAHTNAIEPLVDILLSIDGGISYNTILASGIPNSGFAEVNVPNISSTAARVMVKAHTGAFFNISANNFTLNSVPFLSRVERNPLNMKQAFLYYQDSIISPLSSVALNHLPGATISIDPSHQRFIISNITTPRQVTVSITATFQDGQISTSNAIIIPSILG